MKKFTAFFLCFITAFAAIGYAFIDVDAPDDKSNFTPVLRFMVASDTHLGAAVGKLSQRTMKALKLSYAIAEEDKEYNKLDAAMFCGDITDNGRRDQFVGFKAAMNNALRDGTQLLPIVAKSHDSSTLDKGSLSYLSGMTGLDSDIHTVINGFHFITISTSKVDGEQYSEYQRTWLKEELDKAVNADPTKPIFVANHEHVKDTVYGSTKFDGWGIDYFREILNQYPQVVHFSGHSHYPINDPRSIWQGEFTAVGTGAIKYLEFTIDNDRTLHPDGYKDESEFWIVEVDANNRIRLRGVDLMEEEFLCEYIINDPLSREYTPEKQAAKSKAPVFKSDSLKLKKSFGEYKATFNKADSTDNMPVVLYRAYFLDKDGAELSKIYQLPKYYSADFDDDAEYTMSLGKLPEGTATIKIVAETAYGVQSAPLTATVK